MTLRKRAHSLAHHQEMFWGAVTLTAPQGSTSVA
jgi:hypothetical protein